MLHRPRNPAAKGACRVTEQELRDRRQRLAELHESGLFVMPNAWDTGSARLLAALGFPAVATTSSGLAATLGRLDQRVARNQLTAHVADLAVAVDLPVSVDAEAGYPSDPGGVAETIRLVAAAGAAGCSIEDFDPDAERIAPLDIAVQRVDAAVAEAQRHGLVVTARAENHLYGVDDLDDTIARLQAYRDVGADVVYAPGLTALASIQRVVSEVACPVNVLLQPDGPTLAELAAAGVRRVSTGGALAFVAYGAMAEAAHELIRDGNPRVLERVLDPRLRTTAFN